jgi:hypothetical protein
VTESTHSRSVLALRIAEVVSICVVIAGAVALSVAGPTFELLATDYLAFISVLLGSVGVFLVSSRLLMEARVRRLEEGAALGPPPVEILTQREWYERLCPAIRDATSTIDITHHEPRLPQISGIEAKKQAFRELSKQIAKKDVLIRWLIAVNTADKVTWAEQLIVAHADCDNFSLYHSNVALDYPAPPMSIQIIDGSHLFVIDLSRGHHTASELDTDLYSRDRKLVAQFKRYYDVYWSRATPLKEAGIVHSDTLAALRARFLPSDQAALRDGGSEGEEIAIGATSEARHPSVWARVRHLWSVVAARKA